MSKVKDILVFIVVTWIGTLFLPGTLVAQSTEGQEAKKLPQNALTIVPQYAIFKGLRVDYERRLKSDNNWLVMAPQIFLDISNPYYYSSSSGYDGYNSMYGFGLNLYYKTIVYQSQKGNTNSNLPRHSFYFSAGPNFQYFSFTSTEEVAHPYVENGITYYQYTLEDVKRPIYRIGAIANTGWQMAFDRFLLDIYLGIALKYSMDESGALIKVDYSSWSDPYYSGILLDGGLRVGFFF